MHFVKEQVAKNLIHFQFVPIEFETTAILTKPLSAKISFKLRAKLNIVPNNEITAEGNGKIHEEIKKGKKE